MKKKFKHLSYDSNLFNYWVAKINEVGSFEELENVLSFLEKSNYKLVYLFVNEDNQRCIDWAIKNNGILSDTKINFSKKSSMFHCIDVEDVFIYQDKNITKELIQLALQSGQFSRFKLDNKFINNEFELLYLDWINKSISKEIADYVLVAKKEELIVGMLTLSITDESAKIGLIAVDESMRGSGIGQKLLKKAEYIAHKNNSLQLNVVTQEKNRGAMNFYAKNKYKILSKQFVFHFWL